MKRFSVLVLSSLVLCAGAHAQAPDKAPAGSTAQCNDGTFSSEAKRTQACTRHKGVKTWLGETAAAVQTQSPAVSATQAAPTTGVPSRTPGTLENPIGTPSPKPATPAAK
jgi:hypothetical protein